MTVLTPRDPRKLALMTRHADLSARLTKIEAELGEHDAKDWEDLATEREGDEVLEGMGLSGQQELRQIEAALSRIQSGTYGACVRCGTEIAPDRLDLLPYTPFCRDCAAQRER